MLARVLWFTAWINLLAVCVTRMLRHGAVLAKTAGLYIIHNPICP